MAAKTELTKCLVIITQMTTYSSILVWRIPWIEEPGGLLSVESQRIGHHCSDLAHTHSGKAFMSFPGGAVVKNLLAPLSQ